MHKTENEEKIHIDLFSGIGGFALAAESVWPGIRHVFVEWDPFCQEILKKHWPDAEFHSDIRTFVADARSSQSGGVPDGTREKVSAARGSGASFKDSERKRRTHGKDEKEKSEIRGQRNVSPGDSDRVHILTGGFPCQPFSNAGQRRGTEDDRYLWPPMFDAITLFRPTWVIAENVAGLASWNDGLVLETVCSDLEEAGYEVQPFIIPATAVGAPHRRDRIWIIAHTEGKRIGGSSGKKRGIQERKLVAAESERSSIRSESERCIAAGGDAWAEEWPEVAARLCTVDDGISDGLVRFADGYKTHAWWRNEALTAAGNAIVPQVAARIMQEMA